MPTKVCSPTKGCGQEKDINEFYKKRGSYRHICKKCVDHHNKQYALNNPEKVREKYKRYRKNNPEKVKEKNQKYRVNNVGKIKEKNDRYRRNNVEKLMLRRSIRRAKQKRLEHSISLEDIHIPEYCPVLGIKLQVGEGYNRNNSPSLDRIDNNKGYTKGNIMIVSWRANSLKNDATIEELEKVLAYMRAQQNQQQEEGDHDSEATDR